MMETLKEFLQTQNNNWSLLDHKQELSHLFYICMIAVILHIIDRQVEYILSLNIQWNEQIESDRIESETVGEINRILLENILPPHVLKRYLYNTTVSYDQLYHESVSIKPQLQCRARWAITQRATNCRAGSNQLQGLWQCLWLCSSPPPLSNRKNVRSHSWLRASR